MERLANLMYYEKVGAWIFLGIYVLVHLAWIIYVLVKTR